jgi:hypothetical protein
MHIGEIFDSQRQYQPYDEQLDDVQLQIFYPTHCERTLDLWALLWLLMWSLFCDLALSISHLVK